MTIAMRLKQGTGSGLGALAALILSVAACLGQQGVESITTREGTRATGRTGAPDLTAPAITDNPHAWPLPNNGGWNTVGQNYGTSTLGGSAGKTFETSGLAPAVPVQPAYKWDREGNIVFVNPVTGLTQTYGTNVQRVFR